LPELEQLRREFSSQNVGFLALSLEPDRPLVAQAAVRLRIQMPVAIADGEMLGPLGVNRVPSTAFIDRAGRIVAASSGERSRGFYERRIRALLEP
jgi:hypothetical protein